MSVRHARVRVLFFHQFGRPWVQNIGFADTIYSLFYFFEFRLETGEFEEKVKKEVFWMGKNRQIWLFLCHAHRSPCRFLRRVLLFFSR